MTAILRDALRISLEDVIEEINPLSDHIETELDEVLMEVEEANDTMIESEAVVDELETAEASMEAIYASLEAHIAEGGMNPQTALTHKVAMANALRRLPIDADNYTLSTEAFGGMSDKLESSKAALRNVKEVLMKIWNGIKNAVARAIKAVKEFVTTIGKGAGALRNGANYVKQRAQAASGFKVKGNGEFNAAGAAKMFHSGGKFDSGSVAAGLGVIASGGDAVVAAANGTASALSHAARGIVDGNFDKAAALSAIASAASKGLPGDLPGGYVIETRSANDSVGISMTQRNKFAGSPIIRVPALSQVSQISANVTKIANFLEGYSKKSFKAIESNSNKALEDLRQQINSAEHDDEKAKALKENMSVITKMSSIARGVGPQYCAYAARSAKAGLSFANNIVKQYAAPEKKAAK